MDGAISINWVAIASICGVIALAATLGRYVKTQVSGWLGHRRSDAAEEDRLRVAVFGRTGNSTYPDVPGLEKRVGKVETAVGVLLARTEANHGSSMKDQLDMICDHLGIVVPPLSESQKVPDDMD